MRGALLTGLLRNRHKGSRGKQLVKEKKKVNRNRIIFILKTDFNKESEFMVFNVLSYFHNYSNIFVFTKSRVFLS